MFSGRGTGEKWNRVAFALFFSSIAPFLGQYVLLIPTSATSVFIKDIARSFPAKCHGFMVDDTERDI